MGTCILQLISKYSIVPMSLKRIIIFAGIRFESKIYINKQYKHK